MRRGLLWGIGVFFGTVGVGWLAASRGLGEKGIPTAPDPSPAAAQRRVAALPSAPAGLREAVSVLLPEVSVPVREGAPGELLAGTRRGLYRSTDRGRHWKRIFHPGLAGRAIHEIARDPRDPARIFLAVGDRLYLSFTGGKDWRLLFRGGNGVLSVAVNPFDSQQVFAGTRFGLRVSRDQGQTWENAEGLPPGWVRTILFNPSRSGHCYLWTQQGLFRSLDGGARWERIWIRAISEEGSAAKTAEEDSELAQPVETGDLAFDPSQGALYLGTGQGVFFSLDEGETWKPLSSVGLGTPEILKLLFFSRSGPLCVAAREGLFLLDGTRGIWVRLEEGLPAGPVFTLAAQGERKIWVGTEEGLFSVPIPGAASLEPPVIAAEEAFPGPSIREVQQAAVRYAEVMPEKIRGWRAGAVLRGWFPKLTVSLDRDTDRTVVSSTSGGKTTFSVGPEDEAVSVGFGFTWDLANLVWNPDQVSIDTRSRLMVQLRQEVLEEVTRLYFERMRLLAEFRAHPTGDPVLSAERSLRVQELTARLDALTGNRFSEG